MFSTPSCLRYSRRYIQSFICLFRNTNTCGCRNIDFMTFQFSESIPIHSCTCPSLPPFLFLHSLMFLNSLTPFLFNISSFLNQFSFYYLDYLHLLDFPKNFLLPVVFLPYFSQNLFSRSPKLLHPLVTFFSGIIIFSLSRSLPLLPNT